MNQHNENNQKHGTWEHFWHNGKLEFHGEFNNGIPHGLFESLYMNGKISFRGSYINGNQIGYWIIRNYTEFYL